MSSPRTIKVDCLARVEGEGALYVKVKGRRVVETRLKIYEPPRFFEAFLRGRHFSEAPDLTARVCGICPVAYQMSAVQAIESLLDFAVPRGVRTLRRLLYCGEWIQSHALHVYMLHAPDFLGYQGALDMARDHPAIIHRGFRLRHVGNAIMTLLGGRPVHPINVRVGGFYRTPSRAELTALTDDLKWGREAARETARWAAPFPFPDFVQDYELVALRDPDEYPLDRGRVVSTSGLDIAASEFEREVVEEQVPHSTALHARLHGERPYLTGPLARYSLNFDRLSPLAQETAREAGLGTACRNPFQSILVRAVEMVYACDEALRLIDEYEPPPPVQAPPPRAGVGHACTEAPRGILYHRYEIDPAGRIVDAEIIPPTSQNQKIIERDLARFVEAHAELDRAALTWKCEQVIRNHDPCISCAAHFLDLTVDRASA